METLKEIAGLVHPGKLQSIRMLGFPFSADSKLETLYEGILNNTFDDEKAAALEVLGRPEPNGAYRKIKSNLYNRLIHLLFLTNWNRPAYVNRRRAYQECYKKWAASKLLLGQNARQAGIHLARQILKYARQYEFTLLCMDISRLLKIHYGTIYRDKKQYEHYSQLFEHYFELYRAEAAAEDAYTTLIIQGADQSTDHDAVAELIRRQEEKLTPLTERYQSHDLHLYARLVRLNGAAMEGDIRKVLTVCEDSIAFFEQKSFTARKPLEAFHYQKIICHLQLKSFSASQYAQLIADQPAFLEKGSYNWYKFQEAYTVMGLHLGEYQPAYEVFLAAKNLKHFEGLPPDRQEYWLILHAYFQYLANRKKIKPRKGKSKKFQVGKLLNETPILSKDKQGLNASLLIVEVLHYLHQQNWTKVTDKADAIRHYCYRHLKKEETMRAFYFLKMLLALVKSRFREPIAREKTAQLLDALRTHPLSSSQQAPDIEIIPFERLWDLVLEALPK